MMCPRCCEDRDCDMPDGCRDPECPTPSEMENEAERAYMRQQERDMESPPDARENLIVRLPGQTTTELRNRLRAESWRRLNDRDWERRNNPATISSAITILNSFYGKPEQL